MAKRANAHTIEINSSHTAMVSHPLAVTGLVLAASTGPLTPLTPTGSVHAHRRGGHTTCPAVDGLTPSVTPTGC